MSFADPGIRLKFRLVSFLVGEYGTHVFRRILDVADWTPKAQLHLLVTTEDLRAVRHLTANSSEKGTPCR